MGKSDSTAVTTNENKAEIAVLKARVSELVKPANALEFIRKNTENPLKERVFRQIVVEARGVEPLSETISSSASTGVSCGLTFPTAHAHRRACAFSIL